MGLLFKTTLIHVKKNAFVVSVLSFFIASGVAVLSSSDLLKSNLSKGFEEVNFDSNPHDLILLSKSFQPNQNLNIDPVYPVDYEKEKLEAKWAYRWAFDRLNDNFFTKSGDKDKFPDATQNPTGASGNNTESSPKLLKLPTQAFAIPASDQAWANWYLQCINSTSFFSNVEANFTFRDRNKASYDRWGGSQGVDRWEANTVTASCPGGRAVNGTGNAGTYSNFLNSISSFYESKIVVGDGDGSKTQNLDRSSDAKGDSSLTLSEDEIAEFHRLVGAWNPQYMWAARNTAGGNYFTHLWENDSYLGIAIPLKVFIGGKDLIYKFRELAKHMLSPKIFFKLDETSRSQLNHFVYVNLFNRVYMRYWMSGLSKATEESGLFLPMIPGLTYKETVIIFMKLILWESLIKEEKRFLIIDTATTSRKDIYEYYEKNIKEGLRKIISEWDESDTETGITSWKPFKKFWDGKPAPTYSKPQRFIFSTVRANKTINDAKNFTFKEDIDWDTNKSNVGTKTDKVGGGGNFNNLTKIYSDSDKIIKAVKETFLKWIDDDYYHYDDDDKEYRSKKTQAIPAFRGDSHSNYEKDKNTSEIKVFSDDHPQYYRPYPVPFKDAWRHIRSLINRKIRSYYVTNSVANLKMVRKFISESEIFTLSFLLHNFVFDPTKVEKHRRKRSTKKERDKSLEHDLNLKIPQLAKDEQIVDPKEDISPSINYHKSIVVTNTGSISAKLNDSSKTWHSYKVIAQERKDDSYVNRLKIISGNPLFRVTQDFGTILSKFKNQIKYEFQDFFKVLKRMKYSNPKHDVLTRKMANYFNNPYDDKWKDDTWFNYHDYGGIHTLMRAFVWNLANSVINTGARTSSLLPTAEIIRFARTFDVRAHLEVVPSVAYIEQFSANFAVISPFYAKHNNIKPISNEKYEYFKNLVEGGTTTQEEWEKEYAAFTLNPSNHDHILNVNGNKLIVVGIGMAPDMLLPSHSYINLVPNKEKEALVFVDTHGYANIKFNSLSSWDEHYLSIAYPQEIRNKNLEEDYKQQIFTYIKDFLQEDTNEAIADTFELNQVKGAELNQLVYLRSQYVDKFMFAADSLFNLVLAFLGLIVFFTVWVLIKKYVTSSINTFGVFVANGVYRSKIIFNSSLFIMLPALFGVVVGYLLSLAVQPVIFGLLSNIWYLTPVFSGFSVPVLLSYILIAAAILCPMSWVCSYLMLKNDVSDLMKLNFSFKQNRITQWISQYLHNLSSLWKFRVSVIMNTVGRGLILSSATVFLFVFTSFLFNNFGQFQAVSNYELGTKDYGFSIAYETPSDQSDQPKLVSYTNMGDTFLDSTTHEKEVLVQTSKNNWKKEKLKYNVDNPEVVGSGLKHVYYPKDIEPYFDQCRSSLGINEWYKKLGLLDADYPGNHLDVNPYNDYLFGKAFTRKQTGGKDVNMDCKKPITESFTESNINFVEQKDTSTYIFGSSQKKVNSKEEPKFDPALSADNQITHLGSYVPVKQERRKKDDKKNGNDNGKAYEMEKYDTEPLFKPLVDHYKTKEPLLSKKSSDDNEYKTYDFISKPGNLTEQQLGEDGDSKAKVKGDFVTFDAKDHHPSLARMYKDHSNYWLFAYQDFEAISFNPLFLKNRVLLPIFFNHDWTLSLFGTTITFNPWNEFNEFFSKYSTELVASIETNHANFINEIIKSRYGAFFVNRFMDKHTLPSNDVPDHVPGKKFLYKPTWRVTSDMLDQKIKNEIKDGLYYINPDKLVFFYEKLKSVTVGGGDTATETKQPQASSSSSQQQGKFKHQERFFIFRPDFIYLIFAILKDPHFHTAERAPIKVSFHNNVYVPDYNNQFKEFKIIGNPTEDAKQQLGLVSTDSNTQYEDYNKTPNGDQTYTYLKTEIKGFDQTMDIIGLKQDKRGAYVKLHKDGKLINHLLYRDKFEDGSYPVLINHYTARKLNLQKGSTVDIEVKNTKDRFTKKIKKEKSLKKVTLKVVDIYDSYYRGSFYISQKHANEIIGLDLDYGYNGIHTKKFQSMNDLPMQLTKAISGYSPSGIYAKQTIQKNDPLFFQFLGTQPTHQRLSEVDQSHPFIQPNNSYFIRSKLGIELGDKTFEDHEQLAGLLENTFGKSNTLTSAIVGLENASLFNDFVFSTVSDLIISVINLFITIFTPLLICALLVITNLIIEDLKNLLTILNLLGFTYEENSVTILLYLGIVLAFSTLVALPISSILLSAYVNGIFNTLSIYLPVYLRGDYVLLSLAILLSMFGFSYWTSRRKIKSLYLPVAMKNLNE